MRIYLPLLHPPRLSVFLFKTESIKIMSDHDYSCPIPAEFHSFSTKSPFARCIECECDLTDMDYLIEKAIKKYPGFTAYDVVFEYAICITCAIKMRNSMSEASMKSLSEYMEKNINHQQREKMEQFFPDRMDKFTEQCLVSGIRKNDTDEYQIFAHCRGNQLMPDAMPYMISGKIMEEMQSVLSKETLGEMDDFLGRHFGPPALEKDLPYRRTILV
jgi:hypothetical protein